ncbi:MAG TPA: sugar ABC transporter substrate-binding protein [Chloroflexota bacterium]|nr:sugar ABC transporter substrate-binding protein [Chloroflexota bacterium]
MVQFSHLTRRSFVVRASAFAAGSSAAVLAACGTPTAQNQAAPAAGGIKAEAGTLQWLLWDAGADRLPLYEEIAKSFQAQQSTIKLELVPPTGSGTTTYFDKLKTILAGGQQVDIIGASPVWVPDIAQNSIAKELNGFMARDKSFKIEDYAKGVVDSATWKGKLYMLTLFGNFNLLYYNKALFDRAGVKYPDESWTRDTVLDAAKKLTRVSGNAETDVYGFNFARDLNNVLPWIWQNGGEAFDRPEDPSKATMSSAATVDAVSWLADTVNKHKVAPGEGGAPIPNFTTGRVAMVTQGVNSLGVFSRDSQFPWDVAIHPKGKSGRPNYAGTLFYGVANATKMPDAAWTFAKYLCGVPGQRVFVNKQIGAPVHRELEKEYQQLPPPPANRKAVTDTLPHLKGLPKTVKMMEIYTPVFSETLTAIFRGTISATEGCRQIDERVAGIFGK